jgi:hypothetical protein
MDKTTTYLFEKINKIHKPLARLTNKEKEDANYQYQERKGILSTTL